MKPFRCSNLVYIITLLALTSCQALKTTLPLSPSDIPATPTATSTPLTPIATMTAISLVPIWTSETGSNPNFLTVDQHGNVYLGDESSIRKYDPNGKLVSQWGTPGKGEGQFDGMTGIAVDNQGNVYIADFNNVRVQKFDSTGKFLSQWPTELPIGPAGVAVDQQGNVYVALHRTHDHYVQKFDSNGKLLFAWGSTGSEDGQFGAGSRTGPTDVTIDSQGNVWVADPDNNRVQIFDPNGKFLEKWTRTEGYGPNQFSSPNSVVIDSQGNVYIGDCCRIQKFDSNGNFLVQWLVTGTVDNQGNIYSVDAGKHTITKLQQPSP